jgi:hypothetical protein
MRPSWWELLEQEVPALSALAPGVTADKAGSLVSVPRLLPGVTFRQAAAAVVG